MNLFVLSVLCSYFFVLTHPPGVNGINGLTEVNGTLGHTVLKRNKEATYFTGIGGTVEVYENTEPLTITGINSEVTINENGGYVLIEGENGLITITRNGRLIFVTGSSEKLEINDNIGDIDVYGNHGEIFIDGRNANEWGCDIQKCPKSDCYIIAVHKELKSSDFNSTTDCFPIDDSEIQSRTEEYPNCSNDTDKDRQYVVVYSSGFKEFLREIYEICLQETS